MLLERARAIEDQIVAWRRDIHMHPELSFREHRTARLVADTLGEMGLRVETGVGKTGVIGHLGQGRPAVGIRADMDALPYQEENDVPYASQTPGVMHACGHDAHVAILLGVAHLLSEMDDRPAGEIRFLFQPSEEAIGEDGKTGALGKGSSGAWAMIQDGALADLDAVIALHVSSDMPAGKIEIGSGDISFAVDSFDARIIGKSGYGAYPHFAVDPIFILAQIINAIQGIRTRRIDPMRPAVISIGSVHAGNSPNMIPESVKLNGTMRSYSEEMRRQMSEELEKAFALTRTMGGDYELKILPGLPSLYNDPQIAGLGQQVVREMLGEGGLHPHSPGNWSEDFSYMTQEVPGAMMALGVQIDEEQRPHHSPIFDLDESALPIGAAMLGELACRLLTRMAD